MAKKNETPEVARLSDVELQKLGQLEARRNQVRQVGAEVEREFRDTLELIGDRHGKDFLSGGYRIGPGGEIIEAEASANESAQAEPQQLNG